MVSYGCIHGNGDGVSMFIILLTARHAGSWKRQRFTQLFFMVSPLMNSVYTGYHGWLCVFQKMSLTIMQCIKLICGENH